MGVCGKQRRHRTALHRTPAQSPENVEITEMHYAKHKDRNKGAEQATVLYFSRISSISR